MALTIAHYRLDVLPRFEPIHGPEQEIPSFTLYVPLRLTPDLGQAVYPRVPLGVDPATGAPYNVAVEYQIDNGPPRRIDLRSNGGNGRIDEVTPARIAELCRAMVRRARPYIAIKDALFAGIQWCAEATIHGIPAGSRVRYRALVEANGGVLSGTPWHTLYATAPTFCWDDIRRMHPTFSPDVDGWVVYYRADDRFHHFRVDYLDIGFDGARPDALPDFDLTLTAPGRTLRFTLADPPAAPWLPIIDAAHDYVVLSVPKAELPQIAACSWRGTNIDLVGEPVRGKARVMFIHFCTQGLNDLFAKPLDRYHPPRTFAQVTMRDEHGAYSGRPDTLDDGKPDGYIYALKNHARYRLKYLWTFNGGVLSLLAHDCPRDLDTIRGYIRDGLMEPTLAGYGGHAVPYYQTETNRDDIRSNAGVMKAMLGDVNKVYYLDQRLYKQLPNVIDALKADDLVDYIVVDAPTGFCPFRSTAALKPGAPPSKLESYFLWQDRASGRYILYIDKEMREGMAQGDYLRGKLPKNLRSKLFSLAANPAQFANNLLVYGDDADEASGNGWFDGSYDGPEEDYCDQYAASLEWIAAHPWIEAVGSRDLNPAQDCVGTIDMRSAVSAPLDPDGECCADCYGKPIHYDAWYDNWKLFRSAWLDQTLERISQGVEYALIDMPGAYRNELYDLAKLAFLVALQESQWNKQPVETINGNDANHRRDVFEPEDFVIAASLQLRNAMVYANAAVWAKLAADGRVTAPHCDDGPVVEAVKGLAYGAGRGGFAGPIDADGLHWDRDLLPNMLLYNDRLLAVMDQNGGRITHLFARKGGRAYCVSGTPKAYQFLTDREYHGAEVFCDGEVLQNTVYTPNHAYIACDVREALGVQGWKYDPRTGVDADKRTYYPDNFNSYVGKKLDCQTAEWAYEQTGMKPEPGMTITRFRALLAADREGRRGNGEPIVQHPHPSFKKRIRLDGAQLVVDYFGTTPGHVVANEFGVDLLGQLLRGQGQARADVGRGMIAFTSPDATLTATITTKSGCRFNEETTKGVANLRLHRVLTDCVEIEAPEGGDFRYEISIS